MSSFAEDNTLVGYIRGLCKCYCLGSITNIIIWIMLHVRCTYKVCIQYAFYFYLGW